MKIVHVLRKPLSEKTVADNILKHGCGGLNIDATRIKYEAGHTPPKDANVDKPSSWEGDTYNGDNPYILNSKLKTRQVYTAEGRFPANLILQHFGGLGCPVARMDEQSGVRPSTGNHPSAALNTSIYRPGQPPMAQGRLYADTGGASRFFQQAKDTHDLVEYLDRLIRPVENPIIITVLEHLSAQLRWGDLPPSSVHGAIIDTVNIEDAVFDILKPGGHLFLMGFPQDFRSVCRMEDLGFEVRDSICVLDSPEDVFHYIPKASRSEKESGCFGVEPAQQDASRSEDKVGGNQPHNRGARKRQNSHPTVKPVAVMEALLEDVPVGMPVVDPFMGSGTTMLACLKTRHNGIGIEMSPEYIKIADARVRHWDHTHNGWVQTKIESDVATNAEESEEVSLLEFFRIGG